MGVAEPFHGMNSAELFLDACSAVQRLPCYFAALILGVLAYIALAALLFQNEVEAEYYGTSSVKYLQIKLAEPFHCFDSFGKKVGPEPAHVWKYD